MNVKRIYSPKPFRRNGHRNRLDIANEINGFKEGRSLKQVKLNLNLNSSSTSSSRKDKDKDEENDVEKELSDDFEKLQCEEEILRIYLNGASSSNNSTSCYSVPNNGIDENVFIFDTFYAEDNIGNGRKSPERVGNPFYKNFIKAEQIQLLENIDNIIILNQNNE